MNYEKLWYNLKKFLISQNKQKLVRIMDDMEIREINNEYEKNNNKIGFME